MFLPKSRRILVMESTIRQSKIQENFPINAIIENCYENGCMALEYLLHFDMRAAFDFQARFTLRVFHLGCLVPFRKLEHRGTCMEKFKLKFYHPFVNMEKYDTCATHHVNISLFAAKSKIPVTPCGDKIAFCIT